MANVYFYKIRMYEEGSKKYKSKEDFTKAFKYILQKKDESNCINIDSAPDWVILELMRFDKSINFDNESPVECNLEDADFIFGRIGKKKDITNMHIRDRVTHKSEDIKKNPHQDLEIYTYFYLFFDTSIIVYLGAQSAPGIVKIADMFNKYYEHNNLRVHIVPVTADDMIKILKNKDIVNSMEITSTLPTDEIINIDNLGLNEDSFDDMRDDKDIKITVKIKAKHKNKNLFKENKLVEVASKILGKKPYRLRFKAKNNKERTQTYDAIEKLFTRSVQFRYKANEGENRRKEIERMLFELYIENRSDILKYSKD